MATGDFSFSFNGVEEGLTRTDFIKPQDVPVLFSYSQSENQAFYFVKDATINGEKLDNNDLIIAYNGDEVIGSRYWNGEYTDVPAMGIDSDLIEFTEGYAVEGDKITFKVLTSSGDLIDMDSDVQLEWNYLSMSIINLVDIYIPNEITLGNAYPNPFNPITTLSYEIPSEMHVDLSVYDLAGRQVDELISKIHGQGQYEVTWNADKFATGVYMVKLTTGNIVQVQKVILIK